MDNNERFIEISKRKVLIRQLQSEVNAYEDECRLTFANDVKNFFLSKGYEFGDVYNKAENKFMNLRQLDDNSTFRGVNTPVYYIAGQNKLTVRFEWYLKRNSNVSNIYWYPEKKTLEDFYNRSLKKVLILPLVIERRDKLKKLGGL